MLVDPTQLSFITLFSGVVIFILIMFLPVLLELTKPRDSGPRKIEENGALNKYPLQLVSMEKTEEFKADLALVRKVASILSVLPNLEA